MRKILVFVFMLSVAIAFCELNLQWRYETWDTVNSYPVIADDGTVYFSSWDGNLYALTVDGRARWKYNVGSTIKTSVAIGHDGSVYFWVGDGYLYSPSPNEELKWKLRATRAISSTSAIEIDGTIYFGETTNTFMHPIRMEVWGERRVYRNFLSEKRRNERKEEETYLGGPMF